MLNFLDANDIIYKHQFGFRERHSTQQAIITLVEKITGAWDSDDMVIGVFLDLKKAFDTVPHDILLKKLHAYGIRGNALNPNVSGGGQKSTTPSNYQHRIFPFNYIIVRFR